MAMLSNGSRQDYSFKLLTLDLASPPPISVSLHLAILSFHLSTPRPNPTRVIVIDDQYRFASVAPK